MMGQRLDPRLTTRTDFDRVSPELAVRAGSLPTATLHEAAGKIGVMPPAIKPVSAGMRIAGPAVTVHAPGGDNLWLHRGIYAARPGDVLVVSVSGQYEHGYWGEVMSTASQVRGLAGLVIDGFVRDAVLLAEIGFPVFARGLCIRGTSKDFAARGWINHPTLFDGVTVNAGDLIVGDADGVVAISRERVATVIDAAEQRESAEAAQLERLRRGETTLSMFGWD